MARARAIRSSLQAWLQAGKGRSWLDWRAAEEGGNAQRAGDFVQMIPDRQAVAVG